MRFRVAPLALALLAGFVSSGATAGPPGVTGRLVFSQWTDTTERFDEPEAMICAADPDGSRQARVTDPPERARDGLSAVRPQGDRIAFVRGLGGQLLTVAADGSDLRPFGPTGGTSPVWSAEGASVFLVVGGDLWSYAWPSGDGSRVTATPEPELEPAASPDGAHLAFVRASGAGTTLVLRDLASGDERALAPGFQARNPDWSPDGKRIAFSAGDDLFVVGADGSALTRLGEGTDPAFAPDGALIAFVHEGDVWTMRPDGGSRVNVTRSPVREREPAWQVGSTTPAGGAVPCAIVGTDGDDVLVGTDGRDVFYPLAGDDLVRGLDGQDVVFDVAGSDTIETGDGDDLVFPGGGSDVVRTGPGNDEVRFTGRATEPLTIQAGDGDDVLWGGTASDRLLGEGGNDVLHGHKGPDLVFGGPGDDRVEGNRGDDMVDGGLGNDRIFGGPISDLPRRYDGYDLLLGRAGADRLAGGWQEDRLFGGPGRDRLAGGPHADRLQGDDEPDLFLGESGDDLLLASGGGRDTLWGGPGFDRAAADGSDVRRGIERRLR